MNSKLREALNKYAQDYYQLLRTGAHHEIAESKLAKAEKAIRQAVGEELLEMIKQVPWPKYPGGLEEKIKQWQGGEDA